jgi:(R)-amidase
MSALRLRLIQPALADGDIPGNLAKALRAIAASAGQADLVVFPETHICGFPTPQNIAQLAERVDGPSILAIRTAAQRAGVSVAIGFAENDEGRYFNAAVLIDANGEVRLHYRKNYLYDSDHGVFEPGSTFPVCEWRDIRIGLLICFDIEFPGPVRQLARQGADLIVLLDGMMHPYGYMHRNAIPVRAMDNQCYIAMANRVGPGDQYRFSGESHVADPFGKTITLADTSNETAIDVTLDIAQAEHARAAAAQRASHRIADH